MEYRDDEEEHIQDSENEEVAGAAALPSAAAVYPLEQVQNKDIYYYLIEMFPNRDFNEIRRILIHPPFNIDNLSKEQLIDTYAEYCLHMEVNKNEFHYLQDVIPEEFGFDYIQTLKNIFPNADPTYLVDFVNKNGNNLEAINNFIIENSANPQYPSKTLYFEREHRRKVAKEFILNFDVVKFLSLYKQPFEYFTNEERQCKSDENVLKFLKYQYDDKISEEVIQSMYTNNNYNVYLTFENLKCYITILNKLKNIENDSTDQSQTSINSTSDDLEVSDDVKDSIDDTEDNIIEEEELPNNSKTLYEEKYEEIFSSEKLAELKEDFPYENLEETVLHEIGFAAHKDLVKQFLDIQKKKEDDEFNKCQDKGGLLQCECCFENTISLKVITCGNAHVFCHACVQEHFEIKISEGIFKLDCMLKCDSKFSLEELKRILTKHTFKLFVKQQQDSEIRMANIEGLVSCPFCNYSSIVSSEEKVFNCLNPKCLKQSCRKCKLLNHLPQQCKMDIEIEKVRLMIEEKMTKALIRMCVKCNRSLTKEYGCNKICCTACNISMCYLCNKTVDFDNYKHFRPQGSNLYHLCPLWSDDRFEAKYAAKVAEEIRQEVASTNKELINEVDEYIKKIVPEVPENPQNTYYTSMQYQECPFAEFVRIRDAAMKRK